MTDGPLQIIDRAAKALEHHQSALHLSDEDIASIKRVDYFRSKTRAERRRLERRRPEHFPAVFAAARERIVKEGEPE